MNSITRSFRLPALLLVLLETGCETSDERLVEVTREASQQQADQNRQIAHQNHQLAEASKELIKADAQSRQELLALERELQSERAVVGRQRDELENERRSIVQDRRWDSQAGSAIGGAAVLLGAALPLILCWFLLRGMWSQDNDDSISEVLIHELIVNPAAGLQPALGKDEGGHLPSPNLDESEDDED